MNTGTLGYPHNLGAQFHYNDVRPPIVYIDRNSTAIPNNHYVFTDSTTSILNLPPNPVPGTTVWVTNSSNILSHEVRGNGNRIQGTTTPLVLNVVDVIIGLRFIGGNTGWAIL